MGKNIVGFLWMQIQIVVITAAIALAIVGCSAGLFADLAKDKASACGWSTITYGGFTVAPAPIIPGAGVYVHQRFCRSNTPGSVVSITPEGTMSVSHGTGGNKATIP